MARRKVTDTLRCPPVRILRSVVFNEECARYLVAKDLSGDGTLDWVLTQIYDHFDGKLVDYNGREINLEDRYIDEDFSHSDTRRRINAYKERARRKFRQRLHIDLLDRVMWIHFAIEIEQKLNEA